MKEFTKEGAWIRFKDYLRELAKKGDKPFGCPYLAVLPESVRYKALTYSKGTPICSDAIVVCGFEEVGIHFNDQGQIEIPCYWNDSKFTLSIVNFEPKSPPRHV